MGLMVPRPPRRNHKLPDPSPMKKSKPEWFPVLLVIGLIIYIIAILATC